MRKLLLALFLFRAVLPAQTALWMDISGQWKTAPGDRPEYAQPGFDDSAWTNVELPQPNRGPGRRYWLRKTVQLPRDTDRKQLALTLGALYGIYEVFVNGSPAGGSDSTQVYRPRTFFLSPSLVPEQGSLVIALRVRFFPRGTVFSLNDTGPYVLTNRSNAPLDAGRLALLARWVEYSPTLIFAALFAAIAVLSLLGWAMEPARRELAWFAAVLLVRVASAFIVFRGLLPSAHPFMPGGPSVAGQTSASLVGPLLGEFTLSVLGVRSGLLRIAMWAAWCPYPVILALHGTGGNALASASGGTSVLTLAVILLNWGRLWRRGGPFEEHGLRFGLLLPTLSLMVFPIQQLRGDPLASIMTRLEIGVAGFRVEIDHVFWFLLSLLILTIMMRRVVEDRRDRQRLAGEMSAARTMQEALLNAGGLVTPGWAVEAVYRPALEVGGDFYQVLPGDEGSLLVLVGDVSGKGLKAAMLVSAAVASLRTQLSRKPGEVLEHLNRSLVGQTGGGFVTCCCALFHPNGRVDFANAGHLSPYVGGAEQSVESGLPLGIAAGGVWPETVLSPGDQALTLLSDGVLEAANGHGELFGFDRTQAVSTRTADEIAAAAQAWGQNDDITVVTVRRTSC